MGVTHLTALEVVNDEGYKDPDSFQPLAIDFKPAPAAGTSDAGDSAFLAAIMGNLVPDAALTKTDNYLAGVIGAYTVPGTVATTYQAAGVLGLVGDGAGKPTGAVVGVVDGDSGVITANAAFAYRMNNSNAGSGVDYGLDLFGAAHDGYNEAAILKSDLRLSKEVCILQGAGAPTDGVAGTGAGFAEIGSIYLDRTNGNAYLNAGTKASPTWKLVTRAA